MNSEELDIVAPTLSKSLEDGGGVVGLVASVRDGVLSGKWCPVCLMPVSRSLRSGSFPTCEECGADIPSEQHRAGAVVVQAKKRTEREVEIGRKRQGLVRWLTSSPRRVPLGKAKLIAARKYPY